MAKKRKSAPRARAARMPAASPAAALIARVPQPEGKGAATVAILPAGLAVLKRVASKGASRRIAAAALGIGQRTLDRLIAKDEGVELAWQAGAAVDEAHHLGVLNKAANKGYAAASMFLLKTRHGYRETDDAQQGNVTNLQIVQLPAPMSVEQYAQHLRVRDAAALVALPAPVDVESRVVETADTGRVVR